MTEDRIIASMDRSQAGSIFQAAFNLLREQCLIVKDAREAILKDSAFAAENPGERRAMLVQTLCEIGEMARAMEALEAVEAGRLVPVAEPEPERVPFVVSPPRHDLGLVRRVG